MLRPLYLALILAVLAALLPTEEHTSDAQQATLMQKLPDVEKIMELSILAAKLDKGVQRSAPHLSATLKVDVKVSNKAFSEMKDVLLTLKVRDLEGGVVAAFTTLLYIPLHEEKIYTHYLLLRSGGVMVVEATLHLSGRLLATEHYYIDVTQFNLL